MEDWRMGGMPKEGLLKKAAKVGLKGVKKKTEDICEQKRETSEQRNISKTSNKREEKEAQKAQNIQNRVIRLEKLLGKKYDLEHELARLAGGDTGLVQLKEHILYLWKKEKFHQANLYEEMYCEKAKKWEQNYQKLKDFQKLMSSEQKKNEKLLTSKENELYRLILLVQHEAF